jgi:hypothetical protein
MWWVRSSAAPARATSTLEEALALSAHLLIRGHQVTCVERGGKVVMDAMQIRYALDDLDNAPATSSAPCAEHIPPTP